MQVFIAWSSDRTHRLADALASWLRTVVEGLDVFVSSTIDKGVAWPPEIRRGLRDSGVGIVCLAWERRDSPWLAFEAGALAGTLHFGEGRLHPYLLGLDPYDVPGSLQQFQATRATREETRAMVASLADRHGSPGPWEDRFQTAWPALEQVLGELRWLDLEEAVPGFSDAFYRNTFLTEMPTGTKQRLHRCLVAEHLTKRLEEQRRVVATHCAPDVYQLYAGVCSALREFRDHTEDLLVTDNAVGVDLVGSVEHDRCRILEYLDSLRRQVRA